MSVAVSINLYDHWNMVQGVFSYGEAAVRGLYGFPSVEAVVVFAPLNLGNPVGASDKQNRA